MIRVALHHRTRYAYDRPVTLSPHLVRLRPAPHARTPIVSYSLRIEPSNHFINWQQDPQGNFVARLAFPAPTLRFALDVDLVAELTVINPFDFFLEPSDERFPFAYDEAQRAELAPFLATPPMGSRLEAWLAPLRGVEAQSVHFLVDLNRRVHADVRYLIRMEPGVQSPEETLERASGSCRDSAWLLVEALRHLGLAARFVSGYLIQLMPDVKPLEGPPGPPADFTDLHAWAEVYLPGAGWVGLDPTSGLFAGEGHIPLAATPSPESAAPVAGFVSPGEVTFEHEMTVRRVHEDPRVTKPYSDREWRAILDLGERVDAELAAADVRLTMGGEPTFVSVDDMDGEEWNTAALGPTKRGLAASLIGRLGAAFAPGGLVHAGQGKWYPGESLPRWALTCLWRSDGVPLWRDPELAAHPDRDHHCTLQDAEGFAEALAERLEVGPGFVIAAYEDPLAYVHREGRLPVDVDPEHNTLDDPEERERLRRVFSRGLGTPSGYVLPLVRRETPRGLRWQSGLWMLRARHLFLVPGDSPIGFRLPLQSLPVESSGAPIDVWPTDPLDVFPPLPLFDSAPSVHYKSRAQARVAATVAAGTARQALRPQPAPDAAAGGLVRTAIAMEARNGTLSVFLPPVASASDYVDLVRAIEDTAAVRRTPVLIDGYLPPFDPRLQQVKLTPDPGVIEVNIHPASSWRELVDRTTVLYEQAKASRLGTEKFMLDGRHTGTGGGNHLVLGGPTPAESPFLRRPDLLRSFIGYWLNHPSLSYLFSGVFIGPTSQAPRVDETRADAVYELEIAMNQVPRPGTACPPWLVDRIFRHLLVDVTGNTHRAEMCVDKLYSPDSATGRLGLLELRAFEMPPHPRMSLAQQLLVRVLTAWFWRVPYEARPIRWGTRLHDLFMLPHYVVEDLHVVLRDLGTAGYVLDPAWFAPHIEFRFPVFGRVSYAGATIELRQAIEPWYVLGEEPGVGGTARYVDSSVERLQVRVDGLVPERHTVSCNGIQLPLTATGTPGQYVCGVRYRAWQPPRCLHPTIPVHSPLVFDLVDLAAGQSVGGCTYHVAHPGGRNYETLPVNSNEAEARRRARFSPFGHTPARIGTPLASGNSEFPSTLDLRRWSPAGTGATAGE
jgi:uncharacterized protein (DUF2126 family)/transglutaminase-like putative cysteine protease